MPFVDDLEPFLLAGDVGSACRLLDSLDDEARREAREWFARNRRWFRDVRAREDAARNDPDVPRTERFDTDTWLAQRANASWIVGLCALALCGPTTAAQRVPWGEFWSYRDDSGEAEFVTRLQSKDADWVEVFVETASAQRLGGDGRNAEGTLTRVLRAALVRHGFPAPTGASFYASWLAGSPTVPVARWNTPAAALVDGVCRDPLMPSLLFGYLASGHCGQDPWVVDAAAKSVADGTIDRTALVEHVLVLLTSPQRPKSQDVLVKVLHALDLQAEEVPGGLGYLLGVMATAHGTVAKALQPHALTLVTDGEDLRDLTAVVAARRERGPKAALVKAMTAEPLRSAAGDAAVDESLRLLDAGDDAGFAATIAKARTRLGLRPEAPEPAPAATGLWDLTPVAPPRPTGWDHWPRGRDRRVDVFDTDARRVGERDAHRVGEDILREIASSNFDGRRFVDGVCLPLLGKGRFALAVFTRMWEDLFVAGGLRQAWPVAVGVADAACTTARKPAGIADLLRMMASFAHEVPEQALPPGLASLAAGGAGTKAQHEAQRLAALLARRELRGFVEHLPAGSTGSPHPRPRPTRGLWRDEVDLDPLPSARRVGPLPTDLGSLRRLLSADFGDMRAGVDACFQAPHHTPGSPTTSVTHPDLVLAAVVGAIHEHGADAVRASLTGVTARLRPVPHFLQHQTGSTHQRYEPIDVIAAVDLWIDGVLDTDAYWRLARHAETRTTAVERRTEQPTLSPAELTALAAGLPLLAASLADGGRPPLPHTLESPLARLAFLRACESLLLATVSPVVLSTPAWADGTLELADLVSRLTSVHPATVGPLDLVQALYRLRPTAPTGPDAVELPAVRTEAALTSERGDSSWDASDIVRRWLTGGGLPALDPVVVDGRWATAADPPVRWSECAALPSELLSNPFQWSAVPVESVRAAPRWADRCFDDAFPAAPWFDPRLVPGRAAQPLGVPFHDRVLGLLSAARNDSPEAITAVVLDLARHDRLDPEAASTAALGRLTAGALRLGRLTQRFTDVVELGGLRGLWPSMLAIAAALVEHPRKPSGLPQLLRMLTTYAAEVPSPVVPGALRRFAGAKGTSASHVEARRLVAALDAL